MKKTIIAVLLIVALLAATLTGCTFIRINEQREAEQTLITVSKGDLSLTVSQMELTDYINTYAYTYVNSYGMTVTDAIDYLLEGKIQTKLLTLEAMEYLPTLARRKTAMTGGDVSTPYGVLTWAEYYDAILTVNADIQSTVDGYVDNYIESQNKSAVTNASKDNVERIEIASGLDSEYLVGDTLNINDLKLRIVYKNGQNAEIPVVSSMVSTEFSSESAGDFELILSLDVNVDNNGVIETETLLTENGDYTVKAAPTVKADVDDGTNAHAHTNAYIDTIRYMTEAEIRTWVSSAAGGKRYNYNDGKGVPAKIDIDAMPTSSMSAAEKDAWRQLKSNMSNNNRSLEYYYASGIESQVVSALQHEIYQNVDEEIAVSGTFDANDVVSEFSGLAELDREKFDSIQDPEAKRKAFVSAISSNLDTLYYCPVISDLNQYYYVQHVLLKFDDATYKYIQEAGLSDTDAVAIAQLVERISVTEANPLYDAEWSGDAATWNVADYIAQGQCNYNYVKNNPGKTYANPGVAYLPNKVSATTILENLADELAAASTAQEKLDIFEWYAYRFSDTNSGSFNNDLGYLITPDKSDVSLVDGFYAMGKLLGEAGNYLASGVGTYIVETVPQGNDNDQYRNYVMDYLSGEGNSIQYVMGTDNSSYAGIHIMMLQKVPFTATNTDWNAQSIINSALTAANQKTLTSAVRKSLVSSKRSTAYTNYTGEKLKDYESNTAYVITKEEKKLNALLSQYTGN